MKFREKAFAFIVIVAGTGASIFISTKVMVGLLGVCR